MVRFSLFVLLAACGSSSSTDLPGDAHAGTRNAEHHGDTATAEEGDHGGGMMGGGMHDTGTMGGGMHDTGMMGGGMHDTGMMGGGMHDTGTMGGGMHDTGTMGGCHGGDTGSHGG